MGTKKRRATEAIATQSRVAKPSLRPRSWSPLNVRRDRLQRSSGGGASAGTTHEHAQLSVGGGGGVGGGGEGSRVEREGRRRVGGSSEGQTRPKEGALQCLDGPGGWRGSERGDLGGRALY